MSTRAESKTRTRIGKFHHKGSNQLSYAQFALALDRCKVLRDQTLPYWQGTQYHTTAVENSCSTNQMNLKIVIENGGKR
uniref:Uncharacterized protein n=1 Tax=Arundo donax TaxID=35708 RepID=A0A0A9EK78_ARUDO